MDQLSENLFRFRDTCNVYLIRRGREAVLVDFGAGDILDCLDSLGVERVTVVLMTHHHRDQGQGLARAVAAGIPIWAPYAEQELFRDVESFWQGRELYNNYNMRQDRFSLLENVPLAGTLHDYATVCFAGQEITVIPTPGHTPGSISLLAEVDGRRSAFTGDLIAAPGKVWSMAATQWTYNKAEGAAASIASLLDLRERGPQVLLPSHGEPLCEPIAAIELLVDRLRELLDYRGENPRLYKLRAEPYVPITPHVLWNRTCLSYSYVLLSRGGKALFIDYGYDFLTGMIAGADRAAHRPWLYTLPALKRAFGVSEITAVILTHYHDDHVAGCNLLREVEGSQVWAAGHVAPVLADPGRYDLPCLWYDPTAVDRLLPVETPLRWEEYELTLHAQPGHTQYAVAISFEADGKCFLACGDQYEGPAVDRWNYVYQNRFSPDDYRCSAELYRRVNPDVVLPGHWEPHWVEPGYFERLAERGAALERLHLDLLPLQERDYGADDVCARIEPYQSAGAGGRPVALEATIRNPYAQAAETQVTMVVPPGWQVAEGALQTSLAPRAIGHFTFHVLPPAGSHLRRARVAVDVRIGDHHLGQQAEAVVTVD